MWSRLTGCVLVFAAAAVVVGIGCGDPTLLNPAFVNTFEGGLFPLVPGPDTNLVLVRVVNNTSERLTFIVTVERSTEVADGGADAGTFTESETVELFTQPQALANEAGVLFECSPENPISRIGLGRNLNQPETDAGLFVGGFGDVIPGFGVPGNINPLTSDPEFNNFQCGDTVIFQAIQSISAPGGFRVTPFVLPFELQPADTVRDTFGVAADFLRGRPTEE